MREARAVLALLVAVSAQIGCSQVAAPHNEVIHLVLQANESGGAMDLYSRAEETLAGVSGVIAVKEVPPIEGEPRMKSHLIDLTRESGKASLETLNAALAAHRHRDDPRLSVSLQND